MMTLYWYIRLTMYRMTFDMTFVTLCTSQPDRDDDDIVKYMKNKVAANKINELAKQPGSTVAKQKKFAATDEATLKQQQEQQQAMMKKFDDEHVAFFKTVDPKVEPCADELPSVDFDQQLFVVDRTAKDAQLEVIELSLADIIANEAVANNLVAVPSGIDNDVKATVASLVSKSFKLVSNSQVAIFVAAILWCEARIRLVCAAKSDRSESHV